MRSRLLRFPSRQIQLSARVTLCPCKSNTGLLTRVVGAYHRQISSSRTLQAVQPYILADIGEGQGLTQPGITECQIVSWSVKPGDRVQQFDPICEVQSDKATVEVTSRYDGVIKALHYEQDELAIVGKPLLDIDIADDVQLLEEHTATSTDSSSVCPESTEGIFRGLSEMPEAAFVSNSDINATEGKSTVSQKESAQPTESPVPITPAVRYLLKEKNVDFREIQGTGKDGRITKEDVQRFLSMRKHPPQKSASSGLGATPTPSPAQDVVEDRVFTLSPIEKQMFKSMTQSLSIPHFLYSHDVDITPLNGLRRAIKESTSEAVPSQKLRPLPFILKALSQAFLKYPRANAHLDMTTASSPQLILRSYHNFGIAVDSPNGLVVPVIKNVQNHSVSTLADEVKRLSDLARMGRLNPDDFQGATFTVSNIGSIGGGAVGPIIVAPMVSILAVGKAQPVPVFVTDEAGTERIVKQYRICLSWSADHRVLDGATIARIGEHVSDLLSNVNSWAIGLR